MLLNRLKEAAAGPISAETPEQIEELLYDAQSYGTGVVEEREALEEHLAALLDRSVNEIEELCSSTDFVAVSTAAKIYALYPPPVSEAYKKLEEHLNELVAAARAEIRMLCAAEQPMVISGGLPKFQP